MEEILKNIDLALSCNYSRVFESLNPGATESELSQLNELFETKNLPEDITTIYKWHNGQGGSASLNQNDNRTFLSISEVIDAWEFLNDPMEDVQEPISKAWVPILYNGAGDYVMYESAGDNRGKLISYWHNDPARIVIYESIEEWAKGVLNAAKA